MFASTRIEYNLMKNTGNNELRIKKIAFFFCSFFLYAFNSFSQTDNDPSFYHRSFIHQLGIEARAGYIFPTNTFLEGENEKQKRIETFYSSHLKYSFHFRPNTYVNKIYRGVYQGIGLAHYNFGSSEEIGNPTALYLFQGATITQLSRRLSFHVTSVTTWSYLDRGDEKELF